MKTFTPYSSKNYLLYRYLLSDALYWAGPGTTSYL